MSEITLEELKEKLASQYDEITLLELLGVDSFQLVSKFSDLIEEKYDKLIEEVE